MALNPIQFAGQVIEEFRRYQLTAFPIADPRLRDTGGALCSGHGAFKDSPAPRRAGTCRSLGGSARARRSRL